MRGSWLLLALAMGLEKPAAAQPPHPAIDSVRRIMASMADAIRSKLGHR